MKNNNKLYGFERPLFYIGKRISPYRGLILVIFPLIMFFCFWMETECDFLIWPLGLGLVLAGIGLRFWSVRHSGYRVRGKKKPDSGLTITGPYSYTRNPLYIGNILMLVGMSVLSELLWLVPVVAVFSLFSYTCISIYEEERLSEEYQSEYRKYMQAVPRWVPRTKPYKKGDPFFSWSDIFRTESASIIEVFAIISACGIKEMIS